MNDRASMNQLKDWMRQLFAWHTAESQNVLRMGAAKGMGIDPEQVNRPFPGSPGNTTIANLGMPAADVATAAQQASAGGKAGWLPTALMGLLSTALAGGLGYGLAHWKAPLPSAATNSSSTTTTITNDKKVDPIELEVKWWTDEAGKVHFGPPTPVASPPSAAPAARK